VHAVQEKRQVRLVGPCLVTLDAGRTARRLGQWRVGVVAHRNATSSHVVTRSRAGSAHFICAVVGPTGDCSIFGHNGIA